MYLSRQEALGSQRVFPTAVGKAVVLGLKHRESAGYEQSAVEELKRGTAACWLAGINTNVIQYVSKHGLQYLGEPLCRPLIKHLF